MKKKATRKVDLINDKQENVDSLHTHGLFLLPDKPKRLASFHPLDTFIKHLDWPARPDRLGGPSGLMKAGHTHPAARRGVAVKAGTVGSRLVKPALTWAGYIE